MTGTQVRYPVARRQDQVDWLHGQAVADPYRWLEDADSTETQAWLDGQIELYDAYRHGRSDRDGLIAQLTGLFSGGYVSPPEWFGAVEFRRRLRPGQQYATLDVGDRTLIDPLVWDPSGASTLEAWQPSPDGRLVVVQLSSGGAENCLLYVVDSGTGAVTEGPIDRVRKSSIGWLADGTGFYYVRRLAPELIPGEENYHRRVYLHRVGESPDGDSLIFGQGRALTDFYSVSTWFSAGTSTLAVTAAAGAGAGREVWIADLDATGPDRPRLVEVTGGEPGRTSVVGCSASANLLYLQTDSSAPRGRVVSVPRDDAGAAWTEVVPEDDTAVLTGFVLLQHEITVAVVSRSRHAASELELLTAAGRCPIGLPGLGVAGRVMPSTDQRQAWFSFTDPGRPPTVLRLDLPSLQVTDEGTVPAAAAHTTVVTARSADGTEVRLFVLSPTGRPDRPRPTILNGYGGFGTVMSPEFRAEARAWVDGGGVFVIACLRGGGEEGAAWHRAGTGLGKQRVFEDFDAATDVLVEQGWTTSDRLGIWGASNGGLLVGAALTQHPKKYAAAVCLAPLLDMVRFEHSGLGPSWRREFGSVENRDDFLNLLGYSPYHAVRDGIDYPAVLFGVFGGDSRVDLLHARKMCAALQHASSGRGPVLFRFEEGTGHGARTVASGAAMLADCLSFLRDQLAD